MPPQREQFTFWLIQSKNFFPCVAVLKSYLLDRYPGDSHSRVAVREYVERICRRYIDLGLADPNFEQNLCCGSDARYWQRLSEALIAHELLEVGLNLRQSRDGPDLLIERAGRKIWVEVICPEPIGVPFEWLETQPSNLVVSFPHESILLRWTAAIKEKAEKLLGNPAENYAGYIAKGIVASDDQYVIAVNGRRLRGVFPALMGISQFPFAVEAVFAVGPYQINIDRETLQSTSAGHQHRPIVLKPSGSPVPAYTFLDPAFRPISAIWATDIDECSILGNSKPMAVVHNPDSSNALPVDVLPAYWEYVATKCGKEEFLLEKRSGRLSFST
jgi:type I restriction enzyme S subunit